MKVQLTNQALKNICTVYTILVASTLKKNAYTIPVYLYMLALHTVIYLRTTYNVVLRSVDGSINLLHILLKIALPSLVAVVIVIIIAAATIGCIAKRRRRKEKQRKNSKIPR